MLGNKNHHIEYHFPPEQSALSDEIALNDGSDLFRLWLAVICICHCIIVCCYF